MEEASAIIILFLMLWVLKSRESATRLSYYHTSSIALGTQGKRKWRIYQLLSYLCFCFGYSSVEDVSAIIILVLLLWVLKSRESEGRLKYYYTFSNALDTQVKRK